MVILHNLVLQEEWRCSWEAVQMFLQGDGENLYGRNNAIVYEFEGVGFQGSIKIGVWRSKRGINAARVD